MTKLDEIEARLNAATPGPWLNVSRGDIAYLLRIARAAQIFVCIPNSDHDEELRDNAEDDLREALL